MRRLAAIAALLLALLATAVAPAVAPAQTSAPKTSLYEMESQVMCVTCRTPLAVANGPQADSERALIQRLIGEGMTPAQIKDALVLEYGERVLALPNDDGFNIAIYVVPILVVVVGLAILAIFLPRWRRRARAFAGAPGALGPELDPADARRLDDDLKNYD
ncbi:cytochrome c-type biogenesis protein CcmH [Conexibacter sp. JD483]|uniref:cytochrome c-type biogenesis protein n=1 Tax=unclassified Conexibacter TaxID=2627773 RepID=UPI002718786D|nr:MULTISPECIES: cytochrome c-type biogenesis protein CcmH [unclassified Conexibacter]MDO8188686.1 cytochrome c-type biogenesis protein CcmH [Conexibacter sp. CPCC 205706]MDO8201552.1 cytochrome c-type biogenesis protein CcmH [Conexibacter sp. CPCC 205762]MDR9372686.1 cytochrome c-type biogenesis protein CcmH [Conexibacter sp. JD483]